MGGQFGYLYSKSVPNRDHSRGSDGSKLHGKHFVTGSHPRRRNNFVSKGNDVFHGLIVHEVRSAFNFDHCLIDSNSVMAVLEVKAESEISGILEKDVANRPIDYIDRKSLLTRLVSSMRRCNGLVAVSTSRDSFASSNEGRLLYWMWSTTAAMSK